MPKEADIREALGVILDRDIPAGFGDELITREQIAVWVKETSAVVTSRDIGSTGDASIACGGDFALDVGGTTWTATDGTVKLKLTDYVCQPGSLKRFKFGHPINFVATPESKIPVFLTSRQSLTGTGGFFSGVTITVYSWDASGNPAASVKFDWRCFVPATEHELSVE